MPDISIRLLINLFGALGAAFALWKGGVAERSAALVVIANVLIGTAGHYVAPQSDGIIRLVNDGVTALVLLGITVRFGALWMGGVMLFYAAQFGLHSFYLVTERDSSDYLHALINNINFSGVTWCLVIGAAVAWHSRIKTRRAQALEAQLSPAPPPPV